MANSSALSRSTAAVLAALACLVAAPRSRGQEAQDVPVPRVELIADIGQLVDFLERTHPDPYGALGKLAFHRRVHRLVREIPADGLPLRQAHGRLQTLVAAVGDGHTRVQPLDREAGSDLEGAGLAVDFRVLAQDERSVDPALYVQAAQDDAIPVGARIVSIAGVPMEELRQRQRTWEGYENEFGNLQGLIWRLGTRQGLGEILPEWGGGDSVPVAARSPDGRLHTGSVPLGPAPRSWEGESVPTALRLPETRAGEPAFAFVDEARKVALLRVDNTWAYREGFESLSISGDGNLPLATLFFQRYHGTEPPADPTELVAGLPRATETLSRLVQQMREAGTERLVVDLRRNGGGFSMFVNMLLYYLHGREGWQAFFGNFFTVRRLLDVDMNEASETPASFPWRVGDYDFSGEFEAADQSASEAGSEGFWKATTISFAAELEAGTYEGHYAPPRLDVVVSPRTFSGGFWLAAAMHRLGATLHGVPSGQAGNAFAHVQYLTLANTGITVGSSSRLFVLFPEVEGAMAVLPVTRPLTYDEWARAGFDPNADVLRALASE